MIAHSDSALPRCSIGESKHDASAKVEARVSSLAEVSPEMRKPHPDVAAMQSFGLCVAQFEYNGANSCQDLRRSLIER